PLMSQPAIAGGRLFMAYPAGQRSKQAPQGAANQAKDAGKDAAAGAAAGLPASGHRMLCADLKTGKHIWEQSITAGVISAPVVDGQNLYCTCFDGTSFCLRLADGSVVWKREHAGTSAPVIADGQVVVTAKEMRGPVAYEGLKRMDALKGADKDAALVAT